MKSGGGDIWTPEEDTALQVAVQKFGPNWAKVVTILPEKTPLQAKTRWKLMVMGWRKDTADEKEVRIRINNITL